MLGCNCFPKTSEGTNLIRPFYGVISGNYSSSRILTSHKLSGLSKECMNKSNGLCVISTSTILHLTWSLPDPDWKVHTVHTIAIGSMGSTSLAGRLVENHAPLAASRTNGTERDSGRKWRWFRIHWIATGCWKCCLDFCEVLKDADKQRL